MSLLLQALQKAARNRDENAQNPSAEPDADASLSLEPLSEPQLGKDSESHFGDDAQPVSERRDEPLSSPQDAVGVMRANEAPGYSALDWARDHYMLTFIAGAALFAIFYGLYVYLQVSNPGLFRSPPPPLTAPIETAAAPAPIAANEPPRISGMPDTTSPATMQTQGVQQTRPAPAVDDSSAQTAPQATADANSEIAFAAVPASQSPAPTRQQQAAPVQRRVQRAASPARVAARTDDDGVEVVEIPASATVSALPKSNDVPGQSNIAVESQDAASSQIDPVLMAAYEALRLGNHEKAATLYGQVLSRTPNNVDAMLGLAAITWKQGRPNVASGYYGSVLELDPRNAHAQAGLIAILGNADPVAAETKLKQLIGREPSGFLYFTLGNLYAERGLWSQAQFAYFQAYQLDPDNSDYAFNLAVGLEHLGQSRPALDYYRRALDLSFKKGRANFDQELAIERVGQLSARVK